MGVKVVYNASFGGFSISRACAERMAELGNQEAQKMISGSSDDSSFYGYIYDTHRHDPALVQAVEELGDNACGSFATLCVGVLKGNKYIIQEYDGSESIVEPDDIDWIDI